MNTNWQHHNYVKYHQAQRHNEALTYRLLKTAKIVDNKPGMVTLMLAGLGKLLVSVGTRLQVRYVEMQKALDAQLEPISAAAPVVPTNETP